MLKGEIGLRFFIWRKNNMADGDRVRKESATSERALEEQLIALEKTVKILEQKTRGLEQAEKKLKQIEERQINLEAENSLLLKKALELRNEA